MTGNIKTTTFTRAYGPNKPVNTKRSGDVSAQRSFNPYNTSKNQEIANKRIHDSANALAGRINMRNFGPTIQDLSSTNNLDNMAKAMAYAQLGMQAGQTLAGLTTGIMGLFKNSGSAGNNFGVMTATTLTGKLSNANSFGAISTLEKQVSEKKANLDSGYQELDISDSINEKLSAENVKAGLDLAKVNLDTSALQLSSLDSSDLEGSIKTIETDINDITNFQTSTLPTAKAQVSEQSGIIGQQIQSTNIDIEQLKARKAKDAAAGVDTSAIDKQITDLESKLKELNDKKAKLDAANSALGEVETQCENAITDLQTKKAEVQDMKNFEDNVKDKKYDLAKSQDEQLKKTMDSIDKLTKQIDSLVDKDPSKATKADQNRLAKYNALIQERAGLYKTLGTLTQSLASAGATEFTDSKNRTYTLKNLDKAMNYNYAQTSSPEPLSSENNSGVIANDNTSILDKIDNAKSGETISIGNLSYTLQSDGTFKSDNGGVFTKDQMQRIANEDVRISPFG